MINWVVYLVFHIELEAIMLHTFGENKSVFVYVIHRVAQNSLLALLDIMS